MVRASTISRVSWEARLQSRLGTRNQPQGRRIKTKYPDRYWRIAQACFISSRRTTPFTGPRRTTFHFKTARPAAPCATACSHSCLALGRHHPGGGNVRLSGQLGKSGLPGKFFARDRANCCPSRVNRQDVNVGCAGVFRLPPPSNRCGWLCSNSISVWYRLAIIPLSSPSS